MNVITKKLYAIFDKDGSVKITNIDGSIEQGKIIAADHRMVGLERKDETRSIILISKIEHIEEIDNAST